MTSSSGGAERSEAATRRRGEGVKITVSGGGGILVLGGALIAAAAVGASLAFRRSRRNRRRGPPPPPPTPTQQQKVDQAVEFNENELIGDDETRRGLQSLIPVIQKGESLVRNSVDEDGLICEIDQNPASEIVSAAAESIETKLIMEESEVAHAQEYVVAGKEEEDGDKEENPLISSPEEKTESPDGDDDEQELIGDAKIFQHKEVDCDMRRGIQPLIHDFEFCRKAEFLVHNSVEDKSIRENKQTPDFEIVTAASESIESNLILEESEVALVEEFVVVGKEEEDGDKEENPLTGSREEETESPDDDNDDGDEKEHIGDAKVLQHKEADGNTRRGIQPLIPKAEIFVHDSVEDKSIRETDQTPTFEIVTATSKSIESKQILEESKVDRVEEFEVGKEEEDRDDREENPSVSSQEEETESSDDDEEESETGEEGSDGTGSSSIESTAEAVWPAEAIEQGEKAKSVDMANAAKDEQETEFEHNFANKKVDIAAMMGTMERNEGVEFIITKAHSKGFLLLLALIMAGLLLFCSNVLSLSTINT